MNANTAVAARGPDRMGVMVRSARSLFVYWRVERPCLTVRITDLSGRSVSELLDQTGVRHVTPGAGESAVYVDDVLPGHLYYVELGEASADGFVPLLAAAPVQTPGLPGTDEATSPSSQYHRS